MLRLPLWTVNFKPTLNTTGFVSLRAYADDWANNSVNQTIIRAYRIG